ncbi:MAG TPA: 1,2-phenylacetyl-CoA epoxidase subunit PaaC [Jatrophihabitantaceae bacterium]|jgi:ring-1,2-phenylacetyl-CoA epoxidase subunit PaaC|nr:1,2-phenylacetyl-CoA epoxidase subunit PaaC [Jatrophihabitantaceae bacterium]
MAHEDENAYESLAVAAGGEERWAFGTGFDDPLAGVDTTVPAGVDARALARECVALGDDALILSQRLALWVSNAHELEDEVALANIALDLLGQARLLLTRAAQADPGLRPPNAPPHVPDEDALAYWRDAEQFTNVRLAELDDEHDFAKCIARLFVLTTWRLAVMARLVGSPDPVLAAIAAKAVTELSYHREYAAGWVIRLGDGTDLSHERMHEALAWAWFGHHELFQISDPDVRDEVQRVTDDVRETATLLRREQRCPAHSRSGRRGEHTDDLVTLLADMQAVARANPEATW